MRDDELPLEIRPGIESCTLRNHASDHQIRLRKGITTQAPTCALHAISLLLTLGAGGALHTTTKCQDVVFLIVMFREGLHAHHAMQAIVVGVVGRSCCIVMIIKTSPHLVQNCIPFV